MWANIALLTDRGANLNGDIWALFCSSRCPAQIILKAHELAQQFRELGVPTIGGYHSPVEKECLRVLLRGSQPIILCPARSIENMRLSPAWKGALAEGRLLILSIFDSKHRRSPQHWRASVTHLLRHSRTRYVSPMLRKGARRCNSHSRYRNGANPFSPLTHRQTGCFFNVGRSE